MASFAPNSLFFGHINDTNPNEMLRQIDYSKNSLEDRKQVVKQLLDSEFYTEYFEQWFKVNINSGDFLSEHDNACASLEKMANYLLNSEEVKEQKKETDYVFYTDEIAFQKALNKEVNVEGMGNGLGNENVLHFLKSGKRNFKNSKIQSIKKSDFERNDFLGEVLRTYQSYLVEITKELKDFEKSKLTRYKLSEISGAVKQDMIMSKDMLLGVFGYKSNGEESTVYDWTQCDLTNIEHVKALLYMKPGHRADEDLQYVIEEFVDMIYKARPTKLQKDIILLMRANKGPTEIGETLNISKQRVNKNVNALVDRIVKIAKAGA